MDARSEDPRRHRTLSTPLFGIGGNRGKADPEDARETNRMLIFGSLFPNHRLSRANIARQSGLSRIAVSNVVQDLIDDHILLEYGQDKSQSTRGKKGTLLSVDSSHWNILALDLSRPYVVTGVVTNLQARVMNRIEIPFDSLDSLTADMILSACRELLGLTTFPVLGIGIATPGLVDQNGRILYAANLGWSGIDLRTYLEDELSIPVRVIHDVNCALTAERFFGGCKADSFFVQIASGVGAATLIDDRIVLGTGHAAGEIGHVRVVKDGPLCPCGKQGCLETLISSDALYQRISDEPKHRTQILAEAGTYLGEALAVAANLLNINDVCVYGPADLVNDTFLQAATRELNDDTAIDGMPPSQVRRCQCGDDTALIGAAILVAQQTIRRQSNIAASERRTA